MKIPKPLLIFISNYLLFPTEYVTFIAIQYFIVAEKKVLAFLVINSAWLLFKISEVEASQEF